MPVTLKECFNAENSGQGIQIMTTPCWKKYTTCMMAAQLPDHRPDTRNMRLDKIEDILDDLRQGKMVILMDDEDRENEGDLLMAAECVTPDDINFMARYGRGLICLTLTEDHCRKLDLAANGQ